MHRLDVELAIAFSDSYQEIRTEAPCGCCEACKIDVSERLPRLTTMAMIDLAGKDFSMPINFARILSEHGVQESATVA